MTALHPLHQSQSAMIVRRTAIAKLLRTVFDVERLREGQQQVIESVLDGNDTLAIMPTGGGKSLCYQIPAKMLQGTTIVVSPLISLMKDQIEKLDALGIRAVQVNSSLSREEEEAALESISCGRDRIVFCTPERLSQAAFLEVLKQVKVTLVVIDEAHCISQWGHDFRPAYLDMAPAIEALGRPPVLALTATATDEVVSDIARQLGRPQIRIVNTGIYRANLHFSVAQVTSRDEKFAHALDLVRQHQGIGIIYAATVKAAVALHQKLIDAGESVALYHGKLPAAERKQNQDLFMNGERRIMVATNAFGMGIDKSDTRFVIHLQIPANLEAYYQEAGRAGRDGLDADCTLLFLQEDKRVQQFFLIKSYPTPEELKALYETARAMAQDETLTLDKVARALPDTPDSKLKICLKLLKDGRLLRQNRKLEYLLTCKEPPAALFEQLAAVYAQKQERDRQALEQMVGYAVTGYCRWKILLDYFGDTGSDFEKCGHCDNCLNPPILTLSDTEIRDDEFEPAPQQDANAPSFAVGDRVKVPKFDVGTVVTIAGDQVSIEFPVHGTRTFLAEFVTPA